MRKLHLEFLVQNPSENSVADADILVRDKPDEDDDEDEDRKKDDGDEDDEDDEHSDDGYSE